MQLVAGEINKTYIEYNIVRENIDECSEVIAVVAYCDSTRLFDICKEAGKRVNFYGRLDHSIPVSSNVLRWFLSERNPNFRCSLLRGGLHAKIIWLKGVGVYVGSANLTENGWVGNIEAGMFHKEEDFSDSFHDDLISLVENVKEKSVSLTDEILKWVTETEEKRAQIRDQNKKLQDWFDNKCNVPKVPQLNSVITKALRKEYRKENFLQEWGRTLQLLRDIGYRLKDYRPSWVSKDVPDGVHVDQFLHAYYYIKVRKGNAQPFDEYFQKNVSNPDAALIEQMKWWKAEEYDHDSESEFMHEWAPSTKSMLEQDRVLDLSEIEFKKLVHQVHAMREHATRLENDLLGLPQATYTREEKMDQFASWLYRQKSTQGKGVLETIKYVLYGGSHENLPERLWDVTSKPEWKIQHLGLSSLGEMVGWALPSYFPPRNSRTSKALRALGNDVGVY